LVTELHVKTNYYIDWSRKSIKRIKTLTSAQKNKFYGKKGGNDKVASRFQNINYYFLEGIDYSQTGAYCPTFRINSAAVFNTEATSIFIQDDYAKILGFLCSKVVKFLIKNFIDNSVHASADKLKEVPFVLANKEIAKQVSKFTSQIIEKQKTDPRYDYQSNEQKKIDALVYEAYGLNKADINEVETWYARRYPKLAKYADILPLDDEVEQIKEEIAEESVHAQRVKDLIALGENKRTEYKSTLRYDLRQKSVLPHIEHSVLKTIAAFLNSEGGTLLVGVDDDGNILGLDDDYSTFGKDKNHQDEWVKHFDNITSHAFGNALMGNIKLEFATLEEKAVAIIDVKASTSHVFMKNKADSNRKQFYIRRNGSTVEITDEEILAYVKQRWG
jgi:hypothetical protein